MSQFKESERKLIVVGMRYQKDYYRGLITAGSKVLLVPEPTNSVNPNALSVYSESKETKIGFIRDADLHMAKNVLKCYAGQGEKLYTATVQSVYTNYIVIHVDEGNFIHKYRSPYEESDSLYVSTPSSRYSGVAHPSIGINNSGISVNTTTTTANIINTLNGNTQQSNKETNMNFNTNSIKDSFFREVKNVAFDITTGKLGVTSKDGISVYSKDGVSVNPITDMGVTLPAFAMRVPVADLKEGDILIGNGEPVFFKEFFVDSKEQTTGYKTVSLNGVVQEVGVVTNMFFGKNTVLAVKNMFGETTSGDMNPMMMLAMSGMLGGDSNSKIDPVVLMMMMSGGMGGSNTMNPMMMALMLSKK